MGHYLHYCKSLGAKAPTAPMLLPPMLVPSYYPPPAQLCPDLGNTVRNGRVTYSLVEPRLSGSCREEEGYPEGSIAIVTCEEGYMTATCVTAIICQRGNWSGSLPECISESLFG